MRTSLYLGLLMLFFCFQVSAQTALPLRTIVTENFNFIGSTGTAALPASWKFSAAGAGGSSNWTTGTNVMATTQAASSGVPATGGIYNWATTAGSDRAIGFMTSASYVSSNSIMAYYRNTTGGTVTSVTVAFRIERYVVNSATVSVAFSSSTDGATWTAQTAGDIGPTVFVTGAHAGTFASPQTIYKTVTLNSLSIPDNGDIYFRWVFANTGNVNAQGLGLDDVSVFAGAATPELTAQLKAILQEDNGVQNQFNEGDVIRYGSVIKNTGTGDANNVQIDIPAPAGTTLVPGSIATSALAKDDDFSATFNTTLTSGNVLTNDFGMPSPAVVSFGPTKNGSATTAGGTGSSDNGGVVVVNADGSFSYTPVTGFSGKDKFSYLASTGYAPDNDATVTVTVGTAPNAAADNYSVTGNVSIQPNAAAGILLNDAGTALTITAVNGSAANVGIAIATGQGGDLTVNSDGSFTYNPPAGFEGTDNFTYTIDNGFAASSTATVTLTISGMVWFINNAGANGDGRLSSPFNSLAAFQAVNTGTGTNPAANDNIFIYESATAYTGSVTLLNGQKLIGQDATASLSAITGLTPNASYSTSFPTMNTGTPVTTLSTTIAAMNAINLGSGNTLRGFTLGATTGSGISGSGFGTLILSDVSKNGTGQALALTNGAFGSPATIDNITTSNSSTAVSLTTCTGALTISAGAITGTTSTSFAMSGGTASVSYGGSITQSNNAAMVSISGGHTTGTVSFTTGTLNATNGTGLQFDNADGTYTFNGTTTLNGGDAGIDILNGSNGSFSFSTNTAITNPSGTAFTMSNSNASGSYSGSISDNTGYAVDIDNHETNTFTFQTGNITSTGTGLRVRNSNSGTITFNNPSKSLTTSASTAVDLTTLNSGGTVNFGNGGLIITTTSGAGFAATGGGTISVTGSNNTVTSTTGTAVNITSTTIGASGVTFKSVSANGGANGIVLNGTGSNAFTITGDGANWGSGGTIQNTTGADGATAGNGIYLYNTQNISLSFMKLNDHTNNGIYGQAVRGFAINKTRFTGNHGNSNSGANDESVVHLVDIGGAVSFKNSYFSGGAYNTILLENISGTAPTISSFIADTDTLTTMQGSTADVRSTALLVNLTDGSMTTGTIQNCKIDYWWGNAIHVLSQGTASATVSILNNDCNNTNGALAGAGGIWVAGGTLDYTISNNNIQNTNGTAISADRTNAGTLMKGTIANNTIGTSGVANSGSMQGSGIFASHHGAGTTTVTIQNNTIRQINGSAAISALMGDDVGSGNAGGGFFNTSIQGNNIQESGTSPLSARYGILVTCGVTSGPPADNGTGCFNIGGTGVLANSITNFNIGTGAGENRIRVNQRFLTTARFPGYTGANNDNTALGAYLLSRNTASNYANANNVSFGGPGFTNSPGGAACAQ